MPHPHFKDINILHLRKEKEAIEVLFSGSVSDTALRYALAVEIIGAALGAEFLKKNLPSVFGGKLQGTFIDPAFIADNKEKKFQHLGRLEFLANAIYRLKDEFQFEQWPI